MYTLEIDLSYIASKFMNSLASLDLWACYPSKKLLVTFFSHRLDAQLWKA